MSGHGHVVPNSDGTKARCGGPLHCLTCALELARINGNLAESRLRQRKQLLDDMSDIETALAWERQRAESAEAEAEKLRAMLRRALNAAVNRLSHTGRVCDLCEDADCLGQVSDMARCPVADWILAEANPSSEGA